jgi:serine/threonine-protein kinase RsbW
MKKSEVISLKTEKIKLSLPLIEEYVPIVRLTTSGIASQMGYTYEQIEDFKLVISEIFSKGIEYASSEEWNVDVCFTVCESELDVEMNLIGETLNVENKSTTFLKQKEKEFILVYAKSLMDHISVKLERESLKVAFRKFLYHEEEQNDERIIPFS